MNHHKIKTSKYNESFIVVFNDVFSKDYCEDLISVYKKIDSTPTGFGTSNDIMPRWRNRNTHVWFTGDSSSIIFKTIPEAEKFRKEYFDKNLECFNIYYNEYGTALDGKKFEMHDMKVQEITPGGGYHIWHSEHSVDHPYRVLATMTYLNTFPKGEAETEFLQQGLKITPKQGTVLIWPASFTHTHRGNPPYSQNKYTITSWFNLRAKQKEEKDDRISQ